MPHHTGFSVLGAGIGDRTSSVNVVSLMSTGCTYSESIASSGSVSYTTRAMTYNFFVRANSIPSNLAEIGGGSASVSFSPTVSYDYAVTDKEDNTTYFRNIYYKIAVVEAETILCLLTVRMLALFLETP